MKDKSETPQSPSIPLQVLAVVMIIVIWVFIYLEWFVWLTIFSRGDIYTGIQAVHFGLGCLSGFQAWKLLNSWSIIDQILGFLMVPSTLSCWLMLTIVWLANP